MVEGKIKMECSACKKVRSVTRTAVYYIKKNAGICLSCSMKGNKNHSGVRCSKETKFKMRMAALGKKKSLKHRLNISKSKKGIKTGRIPKSAFKKDRIMSKEEIKKCLRKREMSGLEIKVLHIIEKNNLPYKFVGNGNFFIEKKNPDFININGEKKAIEVYWDRHKEQFAKGGLDGWKSKRKEIFNKYGWQILFIEGTGLTEEKVINVLKGEA